jgi:rRNA maturation RNase YbeY
MIEVAVYVTHRRRRLNRVRAIRAVRAALRAEKVRAGQVTVIGISDPVCRRMNRRFLGHDYPTDVISFPLGPAGVLEGEVYVNLDRAHVQARAYRVTPGHEATRLVIHGTLHLAGYDDRTPAKARRMRRREDQILARVFPGRSRTGRS